MTTFALSLYFPKGYIGEPYWPEMYRIINIQKESGMNRARSAGNRRKALEEYLKSHDMTLDDYEQLEIKAREPFHRDESGGIIIPESSFLAFLVASTDEARSAARPCHPDQVRSRFEVTDFQTGKAEADGVWERFATVTSGTGSKLSNQRGLRSSQYIKDFTAEGRVSFSEEFVKPEVLRRLIEWGGVNVGIGASRKMGWGRFELRDCSVKSG